MKSTNPQPVLVPSDSGKVLSFLGITHKLTPQQTNSGYYLFEFEFEPQSGNGLHVHNFEDEVVYVLEGSIEVRLENQNLKATKGGVVHLPKKIPHALYNPLKNTSKYLAMAIPGGMEKFFDELAEAQEAGLLDNTTHKSISEKYGIEWLE
jgi:quercetin dioxygenase-like cupin family protein